MFACLLIHPIETEGSQNMRLAGGFQDAIDIRQSTG